MENCGHVVSQALARCGFGDELLEAYDSLRWAQFDEFQMFLDGWRERIRNELRTNSQGEMSRKASTLASKLPDSFPVLETLDNYIQPITTLNRPDAIKLFEWNRPLDLQGLVEFVTEKLIWDHKMFLSRFQSERGIFAGLILNDLIARQPGVVLKLARDRSHPSTAFQHEYRVEFDPTTYVSRLQNSLIHPDPNEERVQEMRQKARAAAEDKQDSTSEAEAEDEAEAPKATKVKKSEAKNLLWLPAAVLRRAVPDLVEDFEQNKVDKQKKKEAADARKAAKARGEKPSPAKRKQSKGATKKVTSTQGSNAASPSRCLQGSTIKEGTQSGIAQPSSPVLSSRSSPTLDEMFLSQSSKSQKSATLSVISSQNVVDLCSSPEITKVMPKSSQAQESPCKPPSGLSQTSIRAREVSKTPSVHVLPKKRPQVQDLDLSSSDEDDDLLPTLPDPENIEIRLSKMLPKGKATQGSGTLGFRSTKATVSTTSTAKPVDASHRSKPKARGKPAYVILHSLDCLKASLLTGGHWSRSKLTAIKRPQTLAIFKILGIETTLHVDQHYHTSFCICFRPAQVIVPTATHQVIIVSSCVNKYTARCCFYHGKKEIGLPSHL